jgi:predicted outer membrane repeat protein
VTTAVAASTSRLNRPAFDSRIHPGSLIDLRDPLIRQQQVEDLRQKAIQANLAATQKAQSLGWSISGITSTGQQYQLMAVENGIPRYYTSLNADAAISSGANLLHLPTLSLDGSGFTVGLWDSGPVFTDHPELLGRVTLADTGSAVSNHATLVAGTIGAQGIDLLAKGMAPAVNIDSYDWTSDISEMFSRAATGPDEEGKIYISNHSYGYVTGWQTGSFAQYGGMNFYDYALFAQHWMGNEPSVDFFPDANNYIYYEELKVIADNWLTSSGTSTYWFGVYPEKEDRNFGRYVNETANWDSLCYSAPYYLPFKAASNDRDDAAPANGEMFWYVDSNSGTWTWKFYNDANDPCDDGWDNGGFDTIPPVSTAKNIITVGSVDDAVDSGGLRDHTLANMTGYSCWGPTDDGRIKPDIVANGTDLYSCNDANAYASYSGTSAASPSAAGSAVLLAEHYADLHPSQAMLASTLKGLIIHTATELGNSGPDYKYGWGLMDVNSAADYITADACALDGKYIIESTLANGTTNEYTFTSDDSSVPIIATICWTDPPGTVFEPNDVNGIEDTNNPVLDNNTPMLVNDLDLRIIEADDANMIYLPFILDPNNPDLLASLGDNTADNIEQIRIFDPNNATYTLRITHKGTLTNAAQNYSIIISKLIPIQLLYVDDDAPDDPAHGTPDVAVGGPNSDPLEDGSQAHPFDSIQKAINDVNDANLAIIIVKDSNPIYGGYVGPGNYNINVAGKMATIESEFGPANCTINCEQKGRAFIFESGENALTSIRGLTIINGDANGSQAIVDANGYGGAIYCSGSSPLIYDCTITDNTAGSGGGAIYCDAGSSPVIISCEINFNNCGDPLGTDNEPGGAIYAINSNPLIYDSTIAFNRAYGFGGGIASINSDIVVIYCDISLNDTWITEATNDFNPPDGGGVYIENGSPILYNCLLFGNYATWSGGAISIRAGQFAEPNNAILNPADTTDVVWIGNCDILDNACMASGGGIHSSNDKSLSIVSNSLITNNTGYWSGGIGVNYGSLMWILNCTIADNGVPYPELTGGVRCDYGDTLIENSIIWANSGRQITGIQDGADANDMNFAQFTYCDVQAFDANAWSGPGNISVDPLFARPRFDYHLKTAATDGRFNPETGQFDLEDPVTSPCIDAGNPAYDSSWEPAPNGSRINMGAFGNTNQASRSP